MLLQEKLNKLMEGRKQTAVCDKADVGRTALSGYLKKGAMPPADVAFRLAHAMEVPLEWLLDDDQDWPPPAGDEQSLRGFSNDELARELAYRYRERAEEVIEFLYSVMEHDEWLPVARRALEVPLDKPIPADIEDRVVDAWSFYTTMSKLNTLMPDRMATLIYGDLSDPLKADVLYRDRIEMLHELARQNLCVPVQAIIHYRMCRDTSHSFKNRREEFEFYREKLAEMLDQNIRKIDFDKLMNAWEREQGKAKRKRKT